MPNRTYGPDGRQFQDLTGDSVQRQLPEMMDPPELRQLREMMDPPGSQQLREMMDPPELRQLREMMAPPGSQQLREMMDPPGSQQLREIMYPPGSQQLREMMDSPGLRQLRELMDDPVQRQLREIMYPPELRQLREMMDSPGSRQLREIMDSPEARLIRDLENSPQMRQMRALMNDAVPQLAHALEQHAGAIQMRAASAVDWQHNLADRVAKLHPAWLLRDDPAHSLLGFARLSRLSDAVRSEQPYDPPISKLVESELASIDVEGTDDFSAASGDASAEGLRYPDLIAFPPAYYSNVIIVAGFRLEIPAIPIPEAVESPDASAAFHPSHYRILVDIEQRLRQLVEQKLSALCGPAWIKQRVPEAIQDRWNMRQAEERNAGRTIYAGVQYADFMDLADIIGRKDNWREAFVSIFKSKDDLLVSFRRLHPIRKDIAHGRPLGQADVLMLLTEATRMLKALGVPFN